MEYFNNKISRIFTLFLLSLFLSFGTTMYSQSLQEILRSGKCATCSEVNPSPPKPKTPKPKTPSPQPPMPKAHPNPNSINFLEIPLNNESVAPFNIEKLMKTLEESNKTRFLLDTEKNAIFFPAQIDNNKVSVELTIDSINSKIWISKILFDKNLDSLKLEDYRSIYDQLLQKE